MSDEALQLERIGDGVAVVTHDRPPMNALGLDVIDRLELLVDEISGDDTIRAVVLTATGDRAFSVGMDLKQIGEGVRSRGSLDALLDQRLAVIEAIETCGTPWIATLFGHTLGGGLELALGCTFRLAAEEGCNIGLPELELGTTPAWGGTARLAACVGRQRARSMILRSATIDGPEALAIGLADEVWPRDELLDRALDLARSLAAQPRRSVAGMMAALSPDLTQAEMIAAERAAVLDAMDSPDSIEGMTAFLEKRKPAFNQAVRQQGPEE